MKEPGTGKKKFWMGFATGAVATLIFAAVAVVVASYLYQPIAVAHARKRLKPPPSATEKADYNWQIQTVDGEPVNMADFEDRVVFLQFYSPSCPSCLAELPSVQSLYTKTQNTAVEIVLVSLKKEADAILAAADAEGVTVPLYMAKDKRPAMFRRHGIPATFVLDKQGRVVYRHSGSAQWDDEAFVTFLKGLTTQ